MSVQIFNVPGWSFTQNDEKASKKLDILREQARNILPIQHKSRLILCLFQEMRKTKLFTALKTLPKGVVHHLHFDCAEDQEFYAKYVITDPIVYLGKELNCFKIGTKEEAQKQGWVTMKQAQAKFNSQQHFVKHVSNLTMLNSKEIEQNFTMNLSQAQCWDRFEKKITNFFPILGTAHIFKKYVIHILRKYIKNGYDRIQFRSLLTCLNEYDQNTGQLLKTHHYSKFMQVFDEGFDVVKKQHPVLSVGFIFFGLKMIPKEENEKLLTTVLEQRWSKTIGIDFVQQEDPTGQQTPYDEIANTVLAKFPDLDIKKVYHSGETKDHLNRNVQISVNSGSVRIGHGINVLQHPETIKLCKQKGVCFENNPISNLLLSYIWDPRTAPAPILLGLGIPVTINPDDPGKFGLEDTTMDYFVIFISANWDLRHLKLIALHSINYSITTPQHKQELHKSFNQRWDEWVNSFISE